MRRYLLLGGLMLLLLIHSSDTSIDLFDAHEIANAEAIKWDASVKPYFITSVDDSDESHCVKGADGTRNDWNFDFVAEDTSRHFIITIHDKTVVNKIEAQSNVIDESIITMNELHISTADAVSIAKGKYGLLPGKDWAQGYHFVLEDDGSMLILSVVGLDENGSMKRINFNVKTQEVIP